MTPYKYDEETEPRRIVTIGLSDVQGTPMLTVVSLENKQVVSMNHINPSSSHVSEVKQMLLKLLEQVLK